MGLICPLGRFVPGAFCPLGHFVPWNVLSLGTFCPLGRFVPWDALSLGHLVLGRIVLERFVMGRNGASAATRGPSHLVLVVRPFVEAIRLCADIQIFCEFEFVLYFLQ